MADFVRDADKRPNMRVRGPQQKKRIPALNKDMADLSILLAFSLENIQNIKRNVERLL